jgi:hypothetical protein
MEICVLTKDLNLLNITYYAFGCEIMTQEPPRRTAIKQMAKYGMVFVVGGLSTLGLYSIVRPNYHEEQQPKAPQTSTTQISPVQSVSQTPIINGLEDLRTYKEKNPNVPIGNVRLQYQNWDDPWNVMKINGVVKDEIAGKYNIAVDQKSELALQVRCVTGSPASGVQGRITKNGKYAADLDLNIMLWAPFPPKPFTKLNIYAPDSGDKPIRTLPGEQK